MGIIVISCIVGVLFLIAWVKVMRRHLKLKTAPGVLYWLYGTCSGLFLVTAATMLYAVLTQS